MNKNYEKIELLIPAGNLENLKIAVKYGADAIYIGGQEFSLRAKAKNFSLEDMQNGIDYAHERGVKVYVTANIIAHNNDIDKAKDYFKDLKEINPDAIIVADPGIMMIAKEIMPDMEIHLSTQANNTNYATFNFWASQGVKRIVGARELSFDELKAIREHINGDIDIEAFVHGAMCISYSGRCLLSNYMAGKDANQGACTHPCRWTYNLVEETRPGEYMPVYENERGTYIYNSKDLCMIEYIDELVKSGVYSLKIEGRMKTALYVATVTRAYRQAVDDYLENESIYNEKKSQYMDELRRCSHRQFTTGFYFNKADENDQIYDSNTYIRNYTFVGRVLSYDSDKKVATIEQRNKFSIGDTIEIMKPTGENIEIIVKELYDIEGQPIEAAPHPKQHIKLPIDIELFENEIIRKKENK